MNVVVICVDTFRRDHLGFLKRQAVHTPNLDRLARESAVFEDYRLCSFPTLLNRMEVFTGRPTFPFHDWGRLPFRYPVLAEVFQHCGFTTSLVTDNPHLIDNRFGFDRGFDMVEKIPGRTHDKFQPEAAPMIDLLCPTEKLDVSPKRLARYRRNAWWYRQHGTNTTETLFRRAMQSLERPADKFLLWIDSFGPHEPWDAPQRFREPYPWNADGDAVFWPHYGRASEHYTPADLENIRSLYKAEMSQSDFWVGETVEFLATRKLLENTAVIFCSDHGYYLGEHDLIGKMMKRGAYRPTTIYDEVGQLPLLIRHPDGLGAGRNIPGLCQPQDLFSTVLDLAGLPPVAWEQGSSLVPRMDGQHGAQQFAVGGCHPRKHNVACLSVWTDEWCLIYSPYMGLAGSELYHRATDPGQIHNVIVDHGDVATHHIGLLKSWLGQLGVPPARQRELLLAEPRHWTGKIKNHLLRLRQRTHYFWKYRNYAGRPVTDVDSATDSPIAGGKEQTC